MQDTRESWRLILEALADVESGRLFQPPLLIMAKQRNIEAGALHSAQQDVVQAMARHPSTASYQSDHKLSLRWQLRVDPPRSTAGLAFVELEIRMPEGEGFHAARLRIVTGVTHPGWTLEARGRMDLWQSGRSIFKHFRTEEPTPHHVANDRPSFVLLPDDRLQEAIRSLDDEADRIDRLLKQIWIGS